MKKLTADDLALLASRGKVLNGFHTTTDFGKVKMIEKNKAMMKAAREAEKNPLIGKMLHTSWGYDMTINEFVKIVDVSPTGKTVTCRMLTKEGFNGYQGNVKAGEGEIGPKFRLKVDGDGSFHGSYPFCINDSEDSSWAKNGENCSTRMGYFGLYNGDYVYENHMD